MSANEALRGAIAAHKEGRLGEAEAGYEHVLREQPSEPNALNFLGMLRFHQGRSEEAVGFLRRSVEAKPDNPHALINLGNLLIERADLEGALETFARATQLAPELAIAWYNLGVCLRRMQRPQEAVNALYKAVELDSRHTLAHEALARLLYLLARSSEALEIYRKWLVNEPDNPIAQHMIAAISGEGAPARAADGYVRLVFDHFADTFDRALAELGYRAPQLLADALIKRIGSSTKLDVLDAGCGTGLCGPLLRPAAQRLVGVDLSDGMVNKARQRGMYDELVVQELCEFMRSRPGAFDVVLSADTLCYFGALGEAVAAARSSLREGGILAFTVESLTEDRPGVGFRLEPHGRYSHAEWYVRDVLRAAGFGDVLIGSETLRSESGREVTGHVVTAVVR
jgi:predicted TPR repeat methyltransferase